MIWVLQTLDTFLKFGIQFSNSFVTESIRKLEDGETLKELLRVYSYQTYYEDNIYYLLLQFRIIRNIDNSTLKSQINIALTTLIKSLHKAQYIYPEFPALVTSLCNEEVLFQFADYLLEKHLLVYYGYIEASLNKIASKQNNKILKYLTLLLKDGYVLSEVALKYIRAFPITFSREYITLISYLCVRHK